MAFPAGTEAGHLTAPASGSVEIEGAVEALQQRGVRRVAITWVNHAGAPLVKVVPLTRFAQAVQEVVGFSPVADAFGASGGIDPAHGLARPDGDLRLRAVAQALAPLDPEGGWAWASGERFETGGSPYPGDQRATCRRLQQQLQQQGVELRAGFELEWLVAVPDDQGRPQPIIPGGPYGADRLVEGLDYAAALLDALDGAGIPWLQFHPEYGPSQFELSLDAASPLEAADRLVHARLVVQRQDPGQDGDQPVSAEEFRPSGLVVAANRQVSAVAAGFDYCDRPEDSLRIEAAARVEPGGAPWPRGCGQRWRARRGIAPATGSLCGSRG